MAKPSTVRKDTTVAEDAAARDELGSVTAAQAAAMGPALSLAALGDAGDAEFDPRKVTGALDLEEDDEDDEDTDHEFGDWSPPNELDAPEPQMGMVQRWIRMDLLGRPDSDNRARQSRHGWRPRRLSTIPPEEAKRFPTTIDGKMGGDLVIAGSLVLCERPAKMAARHRQYNDQRRATQEASLVDAHIAANNEKSGAGFGPVRFVERKSKVSRRRPISLAD